jgi:arylsulfatase A-like enzyme
MAAVGSALLLAAAAFAVGSCSITVTHESPGQYHATPQAGDATFDNYVLNPANPTPAAPNAYEGGRMGAAHYRDRGAPASSRAYGELSTGQSDTDNDGTYGAAFYLPPGTVVGEHPAQQGTIDLMRWKDDETGSQGGIRIGEDHRGHLVDSSGGDVEPGHEFALEEGCWNWLVVHQKLRSSASEGPLSEVFLNGRKMISSASVNTSSPIAGTVDRVQFGLVQMGSHPSQETGDLDLFVDNAFITDGNNPQNWGMEEQSSAPLCRPLPNILFIVSDDQRADEMLGATNPIGDLVMPNTRRLFRNGPGGTGGTEFSRAYVTTPLCCPSRASIMTGEYAHNHGKRANGNSELATFAPNLKYSIQRYLHDWWGYRTALFGKFLNGWVHTYDPRHSALVPDRTPPDTHFDEYAMFDGEYKSRGTTVRTCGIDPSDYKIKSYSCIFSEPPVDNVPNSPQYNWDAPGKALENLRYTNDYVSERTQQFLQNQDAPGKDAQPWFLYVAPYQPHESGAPNGPNAWCSMTEGSDPAVANRSRESISDPQIGDPLLKPQYHETDRSDKPNWVQNWSDARQIFEPDIGTPDQCSTRYSGLREQQIRVASDVDKLVNDVFSKLDATGETNDTLAFYISDNGYMWREHSPGGEGVPSECHDNIYQDGAAGAPLPCGPTSKGKPYRESIQVPLYARWPNRPSSWSSFLAPGHTDGRLVANIDLAPTVLDAVGGLLLPPTQYERPMDGQSLRDSSREKLLTEGWASGEEKVPAWASVVWPSGNQYIRTDDNDPNTVGAQPFDEYYTDLTQNDNVFGMTPPPLEAGQLELMRQCSGSTVPAFMNPINPCP